jgi:hypothetical protein
MKVYGLANMKIRGLGDFNMKTKQNKLHSFIDRCSFVAISSIHPFSPLPFIAKLYTSRLKTNPDVYAW